MKSVKKGASLLLSLTLFITNSLFVHSSELNFWTERRKTAAKNTAPASSHLLVFLTPPAQKALPSRLHVPPSLAHIRHLDTSPFRHRRGTVVLIQDIHQNAEAQKNISRIIQHLIEKSNARLIALEGAFGPLDLSLFKNFEDQTDLKTVSDYLLRVNHLTGAMHGLITDPKTLPIVVGVDDEAQYAANVKAYRQSVNLIKPYKDHLAEASRRLMQEKAEILNPLLAEFDQQVELYRNGSLALGEYVKVLQGRTPHLDLFLRSLDAEARLNLSQVEQERSHVLTRLLSKMNEAQRNELLMKSVAYRLGHSGISGFYDDLTYLCQTHQIDLSGTPSLRGYMDYLKQAEAIKADELFKEMRRKENETYAKLTQSPVEKSLVEESRRLYLTGKLLDFALTREEWEEYKSIVDSRESMGQGIINKGSVIYRFSTINYRLNLSPFERFYGQAERRDKLMAQNLLKVLEPGTSVLVTGGFHTQAIAERLNKAGFATITIVPKITKVDTTVGSAYLSIFAQQKTPLEKLFDGERLFLSQRAITSLVKKEFGISLSALKPDRAQERFNRFSTTKANVHVVEDRPNTNNVLIETDHGLLNAQVTLGKEGIQKILYFLVPSPARLLYWLARTKHIQWLTPWVPFLSGVLETFFFRAVFGLVHSTLPTPALVLTMLVVWPLIFGFLLHPYVYYGKSQTPAPATFRDRLKLTGLGFVFSLPFMFAPFLGKDWATFISALEHGFYGEAGRRNGWLLAQIGQKGPDGSDFFDFGGKVAHLSISNTGRLTATGTIDTQRTSPSGQKIYQQETRMWIIGNERRKSYLRWKRQPRGKIFQLLPREFDTTLVGIEQEEDSPRKLRIHRLIGDDEDFPETLLGSERIVDAQLVELNENSKITAVAYRNHLILMLNNQGKVTTRKIGFHSTIQKILWSGSGQELVISLKNKGLKVLQMYQVFHEGYEIELLDLLEGPEHPQFAISSDPKGSGILASTIQGQVHLFDFALGKELMVVPSRDYAPTALSLSPSGKLLAIAENRTVYLHDHQNNQTMVYEANDAISQITFSPDERLLACATMNGRVHVWDTPTHFTRPKPLDPFETAVYDYPYHELPEKLWLTIGMGPVRWFLHLLNGAMGFANFPGTAYGDVLECWGEQKNRGGPANPKVNSTHQGKDFMGRVRKTRVFEGIPAGTEVRATMNGRIIAKFRDAMAWTYVIATGIVNDEGEEYFEFYTHQKPAKLKLPPLKADGSPAIPPLIERELEVGEYVQEGTLLGTIEDPRASYSIVHRHLHFGGAWGPEKFIQHVEKLFSNPNMRKDIDYYPLFDRWEKEGRFRYEDAMIVFEPELRERSAIRVDYPNLRRVLLVLPKGTKAWPLQKPITEFVPGTPTVPVNSLDDAKDRLAKKNFDVAVVTNDESEHYLRQNHPEIAVVRIDYVIPKDDRKKYDTQKEILLQKLFAISRLGPYYDVDLQKLVPLNETMSDQGLSLADVLQQQKIQERRGEKVSDRPVRNVADLVALIDSKREFLHSNWDRWRALVCLAYYVPQAIQAKHLLPQFSRGVNGYFLHPDLTKLKPSTTLPQLLAFLNDPNRFTQWGWEEGQNRADLINLLLATSNLVPEVVSVRGLIPLLRVYLPPKLTARVIEAFKDKNTPTMATVFEAIRKGEPEFKSFLKRIPDTNDTDIKYLTAAFGFVFKELMLWWKTDLPIDGAYSRRTFDHVTSYKVLGFLPWDVARPPDALKAIIDSLNTRIGRSTQELRYVQRQVHELHSLNGSGKIVPHFLSDGTDEEYEFVSNTLLWHWNIAPALLGALIIGLIDGRLPLALLYFGYAFLAHEFLWHGLWGMISWIIENLVLRWGLGKLANSTVLPRLRFSRHAVTVETHTQTFLLRTIERLAFLSPLILFGFAWLLSLIPFVNEIFLFSYLPSLPEMPRNLAAFTSFSWLLFFVPAFVLNVASLIPIQILMSRLLGKTRGRLWVPEQTDGDKLVQDIKRWFLNRSNKEEAYAHALIQISKNENGRHTINEQLDATWKLIHSDPVRKTRAASAVHKIGPLLPRYTGKAISKPVLPPASLWGLNPFWQEVIFRFIPWVSAFAMLLASLMHLVSLGYTGPPLAYGVLGLLASSALLMFTAYQISLPLFVRFHKTNTITGQPFTDNERYLLNIISQRLLERFLRPFSIGVGLASIAMVPIAWFYDFTTALQAGFVLIVLAGLVGLHQSWRPHEAWNDAVRRLVKGDIWVFVFDKDDTLTHALKRIEPAMVQILSETIALGRLIGVISGMSLFNIHAQVTAFFPQDLQKHVYILGSAGGEYSEPGSQTIETRKSWKRHLGESGTRHVIEAIQQATKDMEPVFARAGVNVEELEQHTAKFSIGVIGHSRSAAKVRKKFATQIRRRLKQLPNPERFKEVRVFYSSTHVDIALTDKRDAIEHIADQIANRWSGITRDGILQKTMALGDSQIDVAMLNRVAKAGGVAVFIGKGSTRGLDPRVVVIPGGNIRITQTLLETFLHFYRNPSYDPDRPQQLPNTILMFGLSLIALFLPELPWWLYVPGLLFLIQATLTLMAAGRLRLIDYWFAMPLLQEVVRWATGSVIAFFNIPRLLTLGSLSVDLYWLWVVVIYSMLLTGLEWYLADRQDNYSTSFVIKRILTRLSLAIAFGWFLWEGPALAVPFLENRLGLNGRLWGFNVEDLAAVGLAFFSHSFNNTFLFGLFNLFFNWRWWPRMSPSGLPPLEFNPANAYEAVSRAGLMDKLRPIDVYFALNGIHQNGQSGETLYRMVLPELTAFVQRYGLSEEEAIKLLDQFDLPKPKDVLFARLKAQTAKMKALRDQGQIEEALKLGQDVWRRLKPELHQHPLLEENVEEDLSYFVRVYAVEILRDVGSYREAMDVITDAAGILKEDPYLWAVIGDLHRKLGSPEKGIAKLKNEIHAHPGDLMGFEPVWNALGQLHIMAGTYPEGWDLLWELRNRPNFQRSASFCRTLLILGKESGRLRKTRDWLEQNRLQTIKRHRGDKGFLTELANFYLAYVEFELAYKNKPMALEGLRVAASIFHGTGLSIEQTMLLREHLLMGTEPPQRHPEKTKSIITASKRTDDLRNLELRVSGLKHIIKHHFENGPDNTGRSHVTYFPNDLIPLPIRSDSAYSELRPTLGKLIGLIDETMNHGIRSVDLADYWPLDKLLHVVSDKRAEDTKVRLMELTYNSRHKYVTTAFPLGGKKIRSIKNGQITKPEEQDAFPGRVWALQNPNPVPFKVLWGNHQTDGDMKPWGLSAVIEKTAWPFVNSRGSSPTERMQQTVKILETARFFGWKDGMKYYEVRHKDQIAYAEAQGNTFLRFHSLPPDINGDGSLISSVLGSASFVGLEDLNGVHGAKPDSDGKSRQEPGRARSLLPDQLHRSRRLLIERST